MWWASGPRMGDDLESLILASSPPECCLEVEGVGPLSFSESGYPGSSARWLQLGKGVQRG